jgi:lipopolysaccharide/colanic/teichoic acid biosynthesis glycosyltransferase
MSLKRSFDIAVSSIALVCAAPFMVAAATTMAIVNRSSPIFLQERMGQYGKLFNIIKIKSMRDAFNNAGDPISDDKRTHAVGAWLRRSKLDELPQLINILKGDMSFVGPRPLPKGEVIWINEQIRSLTPPGLTGVYQISGGNILSEPDRFQCDDKYIKEFKKRTEVQNLCNDISIMAKTPMAIIKNWKAPHYRANE